MLDTTLCYIESGGCYLMLHRVKKKNDLNEGKWVGLGGKFEKGETAEQCLLREVKEESGLTLKDWNYRGVVDFISDRWEEENMHLYTATIEEDRPALPECSEGVLEWVPIEELYELPMWEGDRIFFELIASGAPFFRLLLRYEGDTLVEHKLN